MRVHVDTYDDDPAPICVRFDSRGFRITREQAGELARLLSAALAFTAPEGELRESGQTSAPPPGARP